MMGRRKIIEVLREIFNFENEFIYIECEYIPPYESLKDNKEFIRWSEKCKYILKSYSEYPLALEIVKLIEEFNGWNDREDFEVLKEKIRVFIENFQDTEKYDKTNKRTVFISYNQESGKEVADKLEKALSDKVIVKRDVNNVGAWGSFRSFMDTISNQDFVILIITDQYLKSAACMYEVIELMKKKGWKEFTFCIVIDNNIYKDHIKYLKFWQEEYEKLERDSKELDESAKAEISNKIREYGQYKNFIGKFLFQVSDMNNPEPNIAIKKILEKIGAADYE